MLRAYAAGILPSSSLKVTFCAFMFHVTYCFSDFMRDKGEFARLRTTDGGFGLVFAPAFAWLR
jgi:hypothetical protein